MGIYVIILNAELLDLLLLEENMAHYLKNIPEIFWMKKIFWTIVTFTLIKLLKRLLKIMKKIIKNLKFVNRNILLKLRNYP